MATATLNREETVPGKSEREKLETLADLIEQLGLVSLDRVAFHPAPGTATEEDIFTRPNGEKRLYELVDGCLVEKAMGYYESRLAIVLSWFLETFVQEHQLGIVLGSDATIRVAPGLLRLPDVSFVSWDHFPGRKLPPGAVLKVFPDLAVEVISEGNTKKEMRRKLREYFKAGAKLVWFVYPVSKNVQAYTSPTDFTLLGIDDTLDGGGVLIGFQLPIRAWFEQAGQWQR